MSPRSCPPARRRSRSSKSTSPGPSSGGRGASLAQGVAQFAREHFHRAARAAGELQLPLTFGLEAPIAQPLAPRLDGFADAIEIERLALELLGTRHHVRRGADDRAQRGARLDRVLAPCPCRGAGGRECVSLIQVIADGVLAQRLDARGSAELRD